MSLPPAEPVALTGIGLVALFAIWKLKRHTRRSASPQNASDSPNG